MNVLTPAFHTKDRSFVWAQSLFWLIFAAIWMYASPHHWPIGINIISALLNTLFFVILVNINLGILLPRFMLAQSFLVYMAILIAITFVFTPLKVLANHWIASLANDAPPRWMVQANVQFISLLVIAALSSLVRIPLDWLRIQDEKKELITKNIQTELQFLKNQINPHFLFNTLNNLYALTLKKSDQAPEVVLRLSDMMRYMLYECNERDVPIEKEIRYIQNYIELEKLRQSKNLDIQINIDSSVSTQRVAPLLFIPFIENCFKHGIQSSLDNSYIHIFLKADYRHLTFSVENSKPTEMPGQLKARKIGGVGLVNVKKRLSILYPDNHKLNISESPHSYKVELLLNLQKNTIPHGTHIDY